MTYRMTIRSNPRALLLVLILPIIALAGVAMLWLLPLLMGLVALAFALFFDWSLLKFTRRHLSTRIETLTDEILFVLQGDEKTSFPWETITLAGLAWESAGSRGHGKRREKRRAKLFVYQEENDSLFTITEAFENFESLAAELREKTRFRELALAPGGENLKEKLKEILGKT